MDAERVQAEGRLVKGMTAHKHLVQYYDVFIASNASGMYVCINMQCCDGGDLDKVLKRMKAGTVTVPLDQRVQWFVQLFRGLEELHRLHITHRDIKPANIGLAGDPP